MRMVTLLEDNDALSPACLILTDHLNGSRRGHSVSVSTCPWEWGCESIKVDVNAGYSASIESKLSSFPFTTAHRSEWGCS